MGNSGDNRRRIDRTGRDAYNARYRDYMREYRRNRPEKYLLLSAKERAKKFNRAFDLTEDDIHIPETCPIFGTPLIKTGRNGQESSPSIDRIDNNLGYVKGNIVIVSTKANRIKSDATLDELIKLVNFYKQINVENGEHNDTI